MRREKGFGEAYGKNRTGEWEYVEYRADGTYITPPRKSFACASATSRPAATATSSTAVDCPSGLVHPEMEAEKGTLEVEKSRRGHCRSREGDIANR